MARTVKCFLGAAAVVLSAALLGGCPTATPSEFIPGQTGAQSQLGTTIGLQVLAPSSDLSINGGTPVEVVWRLSATSPFATVDVSIDNDRDPNNGVVETPFENLALGSTSVLLNTSRLRNGTFTVLVQLRQLGEIVASAYAPGDITIDQRASLFWNSPRDNFNFDRSSAINPTFDVSWSVSDPDSLISVRVLLDPDGDDPDALPNGNEIVLRESNSQTGDSFTFDLPTDQFQPGTYRLVAVVSDGTNESAFYNPGNIRIRSRISGFHDLRGLESGQSTITGCVFRGSNPRDTAGTFIRSIEDIDNDGFSDFVILAQFGKPVFQFGLQRTGVGEAYLIYGRPQPFTGLVNLNSTGTLFRGEVITGPPENISPLRPSRGITSFTLLSDWDRDGIRELAFGIPFTDSEVVSTISSEGLDGCDPRRYFGSGAVVVMAGSALRPDLGFPGRQVIGLSEIGTLAHAGTSEQRCPEGFYGPKLQSTFECLNSYYRHLAPGAGGVPNSGSIRLGCRFSTNEFNDQFGESVTQGEFDSLIISAPNRDPKIGTRSAAAILGARDVAGGGVISMFFCNVRAGFIPWDLTNVAPANQQFGYNPPSYTNSLLPHFGPYHYIMDDFRPGFLLYLGQVQPDIGTPGYFVDDDDSDSPCVIVYDQQLTPSYTTRFWSDIPGSRLSNVANAGDFTGDGIEDILIGSPRTNSGAGACYLIVGRLRELVRSGDLQIEELGLPSGRARANRIFDGIRIVGDAGDALGTSQDRLGDFNGDGLPDVAIGSPFINNRRGGAAVFFGTRDAINLTEQEIRYAELPERGLGVIFVGQRDGDLAGARVVGPGDVDGDGLADLMIAAPERSVQLDINQDGIVDIDRVRCGVVYLIYGSANLRGTIDLAKVGTPELPGAIFIGANSGDSLGAAVGIQGDRATGVGQAGDVNGDGVNDILLSASRASPQGRVDAGEVYLIYGNPTASASN